jgi:predicted 3-demethylubiquinone-9 3-methyltransferase (glyoxalase superfamily)
MQKIIPNLWFDTNAEEAAALYTSLFKNSKADKVMHYGPSGAKMSGMTEGSVMTVDFSLDGYRFIGINGGKAFKPTPALSISVQCETEEEIDTLWKGLSEGGQVLMELDKYPWGKKYGWLNDKYGVSWQLNVPEDYSVVKNKFAIAFLFVGDKNGKAEEAMNFYTSTFPNSEISFIARYEAREGAPQDEGKVKHGVFTLEGQEFMATDSGLEHKFTFTPGFSLLVNCKDQKEMDEYYEKLSVKPEAEICGWIEDKYGVSWQISSVEFDRMAEELSPEAYDRVMGAMNEMKRLNLEELKKAAEGGN